MNPLVSIAIPTFDRLHYLKDAVASALAQTYHNIEVLIGDDGVSESIHEWCRAVACQDQRVIYQRNERNLGLAGNWNALAKGARGEFIVVIGDDDRLLPDFVMKLVNAIQPAAHVAFANLYLINSKGDRLEAESLQHTRQYHRDLLPAGDVPNAEVVVWRNSVPMSAALIRTEDVRRLGFKEDLNTPEIEFFVRLAQEGARFTFLSEYLSEYRVHPQSATASGLRGERLAEHLLAIAVAPDVETHKRAFLASLLVSAAGRCLQQGEWQLARRFLRSEYYPRPQWKQVKSYFATWSAAYRCLGSRNSWSDTPQSLRDLLSGWIQGVCVSLPAPIGCQLYRLVHRVKHGVSASCSGIPS